MPAIAIKLDRLACTFTRSTAVLAIWLRWASTRWILTLILVRHGIPPRCYQFAGGYFKRVATKRALSQSRLQRARCSRVSRCLLLALRRHFVPPFDSAETESMTLLQ